MADIFYFRIHICKKVFLPALIILQMESERKISLSFWIKFDLIILFNIILLFNEYF